MDGPWLGWIVPALIAACLAKGISDNVPKEQNHPSKVLRLKRRTWRNRGGSQRDFGMFALENETKQSMMNSTLKPHRFSGDASAPVESRFEKFEAERFLGTPAYAHFGRKLQTLFPLPSENSEPEDLRLLLREIQVKLNDGSASTDNRRTSAPAPLETDKEKEMARDSYLPNLIRRPA